MYVNDQSIQIVKAAARMSSETDEALAWRATQEVEAFHELYRRYALPVYRYHVAWKGNAHTAQSLTSQTFFEAYSRLTVYQLGGLFIKRIFGIARDLRVQHSLASGDSLRPDTSVRIDCERFMPESEMTLQVDISSFVRAINRLRDDMAEAFVLRVFAGFDASEIGLIMVKSDVAVKMLIYQTLCELNRLLYLRN